MIHNKCHEWQPDCFAVTLDGKCTILDNTKFKNHNCPFYKTKEQLLEENPTYYDSRERKRKAE